MNRSELATYVKNLGESMQDLNRFDDALMHLAAQEAVFPQNFI